MIKFESQTKYVLGLVSAFVASSTLAAGKVQTTAELQKIVELRQETELAGRAMDEVAKTNAAELDVYIQRKSELQAQISKEELKKSQLRAKIESLEKRLSKNSTARLSELQILEDMLAQLKKHVEGGIPFEQSERLLHLESLSKRLSRRTAVAGALASELWSFYQRELRLGRTTEYKMQEIYLDGAPVSAQIVRLGLMQIFFRTEAGQTGFAVVIAGKMEWTKSTKQEARLVEQLFEKFENNHKAGWFDLPHRALNRSPKSLPLMTSYIEAGSLEYLTSPRKWHSWLALVFSASPALADSKMLAWSEALLQEENYLKTQLTALDEAKSKATRQHRTRLREVQAQIQSLEKSLIQLQSDNEKAEYELKALQAEQMSQLDQANLMAGLWQRMDRSLFEAEMDWKLMTEHQYTPTPAPEKVEVSDLQPKFKEGLDLLEKLSSIQSLTGNFKDDRGILHRQSLIRWGGLASFASDSGNAGFLLGPSSTGELSTISKVPGFKSVNEEQGLMLTTHGDPFPLFVFESLKQKLLMKKHASLWDRIADQLPLLFLGLMFSVVLFIFARLARA